MYTIPMINMGMAAIIATIRRMRIFLWSFIYICRETSSDDGGCHTETWEMGVDVAVEITDIMVRIVK